MPGKGANITQIPKEGQDLTSTRNYRPISLLNNGYKLFTTILVERLKIILQEFIHKDQCGFFYLMVEGQCQNCIRHFEKYGKM